MPSTAHWFFGRDTFSLDEHRLKAASIKRVLAHKLKRGTDSTVGGRGKSQLELGFPTTGRAVGFLLSTELGN